MKIPAWLIGGISGFILLIIYLVFDAVYYPAQPPPGQFIQSMELGIFMIIPFVAIGAILGLVVCSIIKFFKKD